MQRPFTTFLGVDLGGGKGKNTAVARLTWRDDRLWVEEMLARHDGLPLYDGPLGRYLVAHAAGAVCAVDAPLSLPACLRCRRPECPGIDACDDVMKKVGYGVGYRYVHDEPEAREQMSCLPEQLSDRVYFSSLEPE